MKKQFISKLCGGLAAILIAGSSFAQQSKDVKTLPAITVTAATNVSNKVSSIFQSDFKDAVNPSWYRLNKNYLVEFITGDMNNKALYKRNGYLIYHISYGHENNLPKDVRHEIKSNYVDYNITNAINVQQDRRNIWVVNIEDKKNMLIVRIEDGALEEVSNLQKSL